MSTEKKDNAHAAELLEAGSEQSGLRLDVWLDSCFPDLSRSRIQALIRSGGILVDGKSTTCHRKLRAGMKVLVVVPDPVPVDPQPEDIPLDIIYEDASVVVINKPAGMVVHPAAGHFSGTLVNALLYHCEDLAGIGGELRPGIVHRLDKDTSGVMVAVKNDKAMQSIGAQFREGCVHKEYIAFIRGVPRKRKDRIETMIGRSSHDRKKMSARPKSGRQAVTNYEVCDSFGDIALVRAVIETGRTHQIRVHMAHIGHPVLGDRKYGRALDIGIPVSRQMLHAQVLSFTHPESGERVRFEAPLPDDMKLVLETVERRKVEPGVG